MAYCDVRIGEATYEITYTPHPAVPAILSGPADDWQPGEAAWADVTDVQVDGASILPVVSDEAMAAFVKAAEKDMETC